MGKNKKNRGGKGKGAKKKKGVSLPPSHYINKQQNQESLTSDPFILPENSSEIRFSIGGTTLDCKDWFWVGTH